MHWGAAEGTSLLLFCLQMTVYSIFVFPSLDSLIQCVWFGATVFFAQRWVAQGHSYSVPDNNGRTGGHPQGDKNRVFEGKTALITGSVSRGVGREVAKHLYSKGCTVIVTSSSPRVVSDGGAFTSAAEEAFLDIAGCNTLSARRPLDRSSNGNNGQLIEVGPRIAFLPLDLTSPSSVRTAAAEVARYTSNSSGTSSIGCLNFLINNAGSSRTHFAKKGPSAARGGGNEMTQEDWASVPECIAVNFLGPALLTELLLPSVLQGSGRIVNLSCSAHVNVGTGCGSPLDQLKALCGQVTGVGGQSARKKVKDVATKSDAFALSKLCTIYLTIAQAKQLQRMGSRTSTAVSVHPGLVFCGSLIPRSWADVVRWPLLVFSKTYSEAMHPVLECCVAEKPVAGGYYYDCKERVDNMTALALSATDGEACVGWARRTMKCGNTA